MNLIIQYDFKIVILDRYFLHDWYKIKRHLIQKNMNKVINIYYLYIGFIICVCKCVCYTIFYNMLIYEYWYLMENYFYRSDMNKYRIDLGLFIPHIEATGNYDVNGNVLLLPVRSRGEFWASFGQITFNYTFYSFTTYKIIWCLCKPFCI